MNVVFDLGGVLLRWDPLAIVHAFADDAHTRDTLVEGIFRHPDWIELDRGTLSYDEAFRRAEERTGLDAAVFRRAVATAPDALQLQTDTLSLLRDVRRRGHRTFVLSNMHEPVARILEQRYDFWDQFEGVVFSCDVKAVKPEPEIYRHLLDRWDLSAADTVFLDDNLPNIEAALALGIDGIHFRDAADAREELHRRAIV